MAFVNAQELLAAKNTGRFYAYGQKIENEADAQRFLDTALKAALENNQGNKDNRPWELVDIAATLDKTQPWIGFEFETGFDNKKEYQSFINFLWGMDHVAIDREGTGKYPVEIAYPPQPLNEVLAGGSLLLKTLEFVRDNNLTPALNPTTFTCRDVGIHAGLSTQKSREIKNRNDMYGLCQRMSKIMESLSKKEKEKAYGRSVLHWGSANNRGKYVELKMFKAIPDVDTVKGYTHVVHKCAVLLDYLIDHPGVDKLENAFEFLTTDAAPIPA